MKKKNKKKKKISEAEPKKGFGKEPTKVDRPKPPYQVGSGTKLHKGLPKPQFGVDTKLDREIPQFGGKTDVDLPKQSLGTQAINKPQPKFGGPETGMFSKLFPDKERPGSTKTQNTPKSSKPGANKGLSLTGKPVPAPDDESLKDLYPFDDPHIRAPSDPNLNPYLPRSGNAPVTKVGRTPPGAKSQQRDTTKPQFGGTPTVGDKPSNVPMAADVVGSKNKYLLNTVNNMKKSVTLQVSASPFGDFVKITRNPDGTFSANKGRVEYRDGSSIGEKDMTPEEVVRAVDKLSRKERVRGIVAMENKNSVDIIRKKLLLKKINEHFTNKPKAKSVIIKSSIGGKNTIWRVTRENNDFNIVEVNTVRKEYLLSEAPMTFDAGAVGGQKPAVGQASRGQTSQQYNLDQFAQLDTKDQLSMLQNGMVPLNADSIAVTFGGLLKPGAGKDVVELRNFVEKNMNKVQPAAKQAVGSVLGFLTVLSNQRRLMQAGKDPLKEAEGEAPPKPEEDGAGLETSKAPEEPEDADTEQEVPTDEERPKTGEEMQLKQLVQNKPVKDIDIFSDKEGDHALLNLAGLSNPVDIVFTELGEIKYKLGELVRVLKTKTKDQE